MQHPSMQPRHAASTQPRFGGDNYAYVVEKNGRTMIELHGASDSELHHFIHEHPTAHYFKK